MPTDHMHTSPPASNHDIAHPSNTFVDTLSPTQATGTVTAIHDQGIGDIYAPMPTEAAPAPSMTSFHSPSTSNIITAPTQTSLSHQPSAVPTNAPTAPVANAPVSPAAGKTCLDVK